jgi:hypothetical protein
MRGVQAKTIQRVRANRKCARFALDCNLLAFRNRNRPGRKRRQAVIGVNEQCSRKQTETPGATFLVYINRGLRDRLAADTGRVGPAGHVAFAIETLVNLVAECRCARDRPRGRQSCVIEDNGFSHGRAAAIALVVVVDLNHAALLDSFEVSDDRAATDD